MRIRFESSFELAHLSSRSLSTVCDQLRVQLTHVEVDQVRVQSETNRIRVSFTIEATSFTQANILSGRLLLCALHKIGFPVSELDDIRRINSLEELDDMNERLLLAQSRQLSFA